MPLSAHQAGTIPETGVLFCALSPARNYLVTVQRPVKGEDGLPAKNLKVRSACGGVVSLSSVSAVWPIDRQFGFLHCYTYSYIVTYAQ